MKRLEQLQNLLKDSPNDSFILYAIAKEYEGMGDDKAALTFFMNLKKDNPQYVGLYYHLGKLYERIGEESTAFYTYKEGMQIAKKQGDDHAFRELAAAKLELGDDDDFE